MSETIRGVIEEKEISTGNKADGSEWQRTAIRVNGKKYSGFGAIKAKKGDSVEFTIERQVKGDKTYENIVGEVKVVDGDVVAAQAAMEAKGKPSGEQKKMTTPSNGDAKETYWKKREENEELKEERIMRMATLNSSLEYHSILARADMIDELGIKSEKELRASVLKIAKEFAGEVSA